MGFALQANEPAGSIVDELRAEGVSYEDIRTALDLQDTQRGSGVPVLPLRVICGLEKPQRRISSVFLNTTRALVSVPRGGRPTGGLHITNRKIWANSVKTESPEEAEFVRPLAAELRDRLYKAADSTLHYARELATQARAGTRVLTEQEALVVQFTTSCREILLAMVSKERRRKGWLSPDYDTIATWTRLSRSTVHRSLNVLKAMGLLDWIRRFTYSHDDVRGARSEQTSNLYRIALPAWLAKRLKLDVPPPVDEVTRRETILEDHAAMLASLSASERVSLMPRDPVQRALLVAAGHRVDRRLRADAEAQECQKNIAPPENSISSKNRERESAWSADTPALTGQSTE